MRRVYAVIPDGIGIVPFCKLIKSTSESDCEFSCSSTGDHVLKSILFRYGFQKGNGKHTPPFQSQAPIRFPPLPRTTPNSPPTSSSSSLHPVRRRRRAPSAVSYAGAKARGATATTPSRRQTASRASDSSSFAATPWNLPPPPSTPHAATSSPASAGTDPLFLSLCLLDSTAEMSAF